MGGGSPVSRIFISHSSRDKEFASRLVSDLKEMGHSVWLDEVDIRVGQCIMSEIENGLSSADYVVIVLSPNSVNSGWVEKEWKTKYWDEISQGKTMVLPALIENCTIPALLKTKKYADFRKSYGVGLVQLMGAISPVVSSTVLQSCSTNELNTRISELLGRVQSRSVPLSQCVADALTLAQRTKSTELELFCRGELSGWVKGYGRGTITLDYRKVEAFFSLSEINMQYIGWGGNTSVIWEYMWRDHENFFPRMLFISEPISKIESQPPVDPRKALLTMSLRRRDVLPNPKHPDESVIVYLRGDVYQQILESIRAELTLRLLELLP